jgi:crotonobetainyl-CoA:carnitine CoA-transferase CaiB-like acyl-CoA transferase
MTNNTDGEDGSTGRQVASRSEESSPTRRDAIRSIGFAAVGTALASGMPQGAPDAAAQGSAAGSLAAQTGTLPFQHVRIIERSTTLVGRLTGLMFADQGAEVFVSRRAPSGPDGLDDAYFDRGKIALPPGGLADASSADVIIVDGEEPVSHAPHQIVLRIAAALPGDEAYGHLPADCSEDLLNALVGFFTDMNISGPMLGRPVIYSPLPLCSVYAGVNGAIAIGAALVDRERSGQGRELIASRLAGGLSAIGALSLTSKGLPAHLSPIVIGGLPEGVSPEQFRTLAAEAIKDPARQLWLEQRFGVLSVPYKASDGRFILPMAGPNRRLTQRALRALGLWDEALAAGMVDANVFDPANAAYARRNLADSLALNFPLASQLADKLAAAFAKRTSAEWERYLAAQGVPAAIVLSWDEWRKDRDALASRIFAPVSGQEGVQIGRSSWVASARPYPDLQGARRADRLSPRAAPPPNGAGKPPNRLPLAGYSVVDFSNVVAGPSCGRMFVELGATVYHVVPMAPNHSPTIVVNWSGEMGVGKRSIILDTRTQGGAEIVRKLVAKADFVLGNMLDDQMARLRIDPVSLAQLNPTSIGIQLLALRGERYGRRSNDMGYDPSIQGTTGIMSRFGQEAAPSFHGIASCVDYLCGYLAVWAGVTALAAREHRRDGRGDWAETSLATAATLTQLLLQKTAEPETARGPYATGMNAGERVYRLSDGWIFAQGKSDLTKELGDRKVADALAYLAKQNILAVPVQTCRQLADRHREKPTKTVRFEKREKDGWETECFAPTWFAFDGEPSPRPAAASRIGADAPMILAELGYGREEIDRLVSSGAIGRTEWRKQ